jgi:hypothetical protein
MKTGLSQERPCAVLGCCERQRVGLRDLGNNPSQFRQLIQLDKTLSGEHECSVFLLWCIAPSLLVNLLEDYGEVFVNGG